MADETKKGDKPTAQIYSLVSASGRVIKDLGPNGGLTPNGAVQDNAFEPEDEYQQLYVGATRDQGIIQPPYVLRTLDRLAQENNALGPCIEAMVTNCDGTGYTFETAEESDEEEDNDEDDSNIDELNQFFDQPWPGQSFTTLRKLRRRDLERTGNAFFEVLRNAQDEIVFLRHVDAKMMRLLRLDDAVPMPVTVTRGGVDVTLTVMTRERRYCQIVNGVSLMYFKEFGSKRDLHKKTAVWAPMGNRLPAVMRATEIMHFTLIPDSHTPYGVPRWINQLPSVLGSRKAEEFNLEFFDNGGVPPVLVLLQGGTLMPETRKALQQMTTGEAKKNNRVQILEVEPSGGSLTQTPQARVTVERFGGDRTSDSMFEKYDDKCEERVRRAFRLPPIFVGQSKDYNFATAFASYVVAEAQVFKPERDAFDEAMSMRLLPAMDYADYALKSKPLVIEDATMKLQGIEIVAGMQQVEPKDIVDAINKVVGLRLKVSDDAQSLKDTIAPQMPPGTTHAMDAAGNITPINPMPGAGQGDNGPKAPPGPGANGQSAGKLAVPKMQSLMGGKGPTTKPASGGMSAMKSDGPATGLELAHGMLKALRKRDFVGLSKSLGIFNALDESAQTRVMAATADLQFLDPSLDPSGLSELASCTLATMAHHHEH